MTAVRYRVLLGAMAALAAAVRLLNIFVWRPTCAPGDPIAAVRAGAPVRADEAGSCFAIAGDALYGYIQGRLLAEGEWFVGSADWVVSGGTRLVPSAGDPPLFALVLGLAARLGLTSGTAARVVCAALGVAGVVLLAMVARRVAGELAGLVTAAIAAVYPMLWINDAMVLSESLYVPMVALVMLAAYRFWDEPTVLRAASLGGAIALAALTRAEALLLFAFVVLPLAWGLRSEGALKVTVRIGVCGAVGVVLLAPWLAFNAARFEEPVFMTSGTGAVLLAGSCDPAFEGDSIGYYGANCYDEYLRYGYVTGDPRFPGCDAATAAVALVPFDKRTRVENESLRPCYPDPLVLDESQRDAISRDFAMRYLRNHERQIPSVVAARVGRMWDLYRPAQNVQLNYQVEGRGRIASWAGLLMYYALVPAAVLGAIVLGRRGIPRSPLLAMAVVVTITAALSFGVTRYRVPADAMLTVLAGVGVAHLGARTVPGAGTGTIVRRRRTATGRGATDDDGPTGRDGRAGAEDAPEDGPEDGENDGAEDGADRGPVVSDA